MVPRVWMTLKWKLLYFEKNIFFLITRLINCDHYIMLSTVIVTSKVFINVAFLSQRSKYRHKHGMIFLISPQQIEIKDKRNQYLLWKSTIFVIARISF